MQAGKWKSKSWFLKRLTWAIYFNAGPFSTLSRKERQVQWKGKVLKCLWRWVQAALCWWSSECLHPHPSQALRRVEPNGSLRAYLKQKETKKRLNLPRHLGHQPDPKAFKFSYLLSPVPQISWSICPFQTQCLLVFTSLLVSCPYLECSTPSLNVQVPTRMSFPLKTSVLFHCH